MHVWIENQICFIDIKSAYHGESRWSFVQNLVLKTCGAQPQAFWHECHPSAGAVHCPFSLSSSSLATAERKGVQNENGQCSCNTGEQWIFSGWEGRRRVGGERRREDQAHEEGRDGGSFCSWIITPPPPVQGSLAQISLALRPFKCKPGAKETHGCRSKCSLTLRRPWQ